MPFAFSSYQHLLQMSTHYPELKSFMKLDFNDIAVSPSFDLTFVSRYHQPYFRTNCIYGTGLVDTGKDCFQSGKEVLLKMDNLDLEYSILNSKVVPFAIYSTQIGFLYNARVGLEDGD